MSKFILHGADAKSALLRGIDFLVDAVKITEGPRGRNVILGQRKLGQSPKITKDGVTVANYSDPNDPTEQMGADLIREACQKTDNTVGDGTTCTAVIAQAMVHRGFDFIKNGANPMAMEIGIHKAVDIVLSRLIELSVPVEGDKVFQVATVSAHGDETIGRLVSYACQKAGTDGIITAEPSSTSSTHIESVAGMELPKSNLIHASFITHPEEVKAEYPDCSILLWEGVIGSAKSLVPILSKLKDPQTTTPLLLIAGGYEQEALAVIIGSRQRYALQIVPVRLDAYGERRKEIMRDIAALTGGKAFTEDMGTKIENVQFSDFGRARKVIVDMNKTQIIEGKGNQAELTGRVNEIRQRMESVTGLEKSALQIRLAALLGGITIIKVGGVTVTEMEEKKDRVIDAMSAAKAAIESGIVAGGGMALIQASQFIPAMDLSPEEKVGAFVVRESCLSVLKQITENAGLSGDSIVSQALTSKLGYNVVTGQWEDLITTGILDPTKVIMESLKNAAAVSCSILTSGCTIAEQPEKTDE